MHFNKIRQSNCPPPYPPPLRFATLSPSLSQRGGVRGGDTRERGLGGEDMPHLILKHHYRLPTHNGVDNDLRGKGNCPTILFPHHLPCRTESTFDCTMYGGGTDYVGCLP